MYEYKKYACSGKYVHQWRISAVLLRIFYACCIIRQEGDPDV